MTCTHDPDPRTDSEDSADGPAPRELTDVISARASDPSEAEEVVTGLYLPHRLQLPADDEALDMKLDALTLTSVTIGRLGYGRDLRLVTEEASQFHVNTPLTGRACSRSGSSDPLVTSPREAAVFAPGELAQIDWAERCTQLCLMISRGALEAELEQMLGRPVTTPLRFEFGMDLSTPMGRSWAETLRLVVNELDHGPGLASHAFAFRHAERLLLDGILLGQRHNYQDALFRAAPPAPSGPVARAVELIQERPDALWSTSSLAREVHLSVRALQEGFKRHVGRPPMSYLRDVRMRRVHAELRTSAPGSTTVSSVASRWGIVHMGRFAGAYRTLFGESPRETLARRPD
jgi:AraC-like DNA-binding protein